MATVLPAAALGASPLSAPACPASLLAEAKHASTDRLAAVNQFTLNPEEPKRSLQELVQALEETIDNNKDDLNRLYNVMMSYDYTGNEWKRFEFWNEEKKYTRNLVACVPGKFALLLLCWNPGKASPTHAHAGSMCFMRIVHGKLVEKQFVVKNGEGDPAGKEAWNNGKPHCDTLSADDLQLTHEREFQTGGCTFINDSLGVHQVFNRTDGPAVSLHCYLPEYITCKSYIEETGNGQQCSVFKCQQSTIAFDTEHGERVQE